MPDTNYQLQVASRKSQGARSVFRSSSLRHAVTSSCLSLLIASILLMSFSKIQSQTPGCTDPQANNYNPSATINDGSCTYDQTIYTPTDFFLLPSDVDETSGLIFYQDAIWTHNDSGNDPILYMIDSLTGDILKEAFISNFSNTDWEDIDQDEDYIYIGDIGNNSGDRQDLKILRITKSEISSKYYDTVAAEVIEYHYSDQSSFPPMPNGNNFDCEAMIVDGDSIFLFSKNWQNLKTKLYRLPKIPGNYTAELVDSLDVSGLITGAAIDKTNGVVLLSGYASYVPMMWLLFDYSQGYFSGNKRRIDMPGILGAQTEGVCFSDENNVFISSEDTKIFSQRVFNVPLSQWLYSGSTYVYHVYYEEEISIKPNPATNKVRIEIVGDDKEEPVVEIFDQMGNSCDLHYSVFTPTEKGCSVSLNIEHLSPGFYILKVSKANRIKVAKLIIN